jgi:hypothetical protein
MHVKGEGRAAGCQPMSTVQLYTGAQINFGDLIHIEPKIGSLVSCRDEEEVEAEMTAALFETLQLALPLGIIQMNCFCSSFPPPPKLYVLVP